MNTIKNSTDIRTNNLRRIIRILHGSKPLTKTYLSAQTGLSFPTILNLLGDLQSSGLIEEVGYASSSGGRKPMCFQFNNNARYSVGIDVNTHYFFIVFTNLGGEILHTKQLQCDFDGTAAYWDKVSMLVETLTDTLGFDRNKLLGICVSMPTTFFSFEPDPSAAKDFVPAESIHEHFKEKVTVVSSGEVAGISYLWHSDIKSSAFIILLDRYIEAAFLEYDALTGHIITRPSNIAHMIVNRNGKKCICGKHGCLQTYCSSSQIVDSVIGLDTSLDLLAVDSSKGPFNYYDFFAGLKESENAEHAALWDKYLSVLATVVSNLHTVYDIDIIIGGEMFPHISNDFENFSQKLREISLSDDTSYVHMGLFAQFDKALSAALSLCDKFLSSLPTA